MIKDNDDSWMRIMDIRAPHGTKVRVTVKDGEVWNGTDSDKEHVEKHLKTDQIYTVDETEVHSYHTKVYLVEFPGIAFNSCNLQEVEDDKPSDYPDLSKTGTSEYPKPDEPKSKSAIELINHSDNVFTDISSELWRAYELPSGKVVKVYKPQYLSVSESGGHRLLDSQGISHYIPKGWVHLYWKAEGGKPHFVK